MLTDGQTNGWKSGCLYCTLLQAGATKRHDSVMCIWMATIQHKIDVPYTEYIANEVEHTGR